MSDDERRATYEFTEAHDCGHDKAQFSSRVRGGPSYCSECGAIGVVDRFAITIPCEPRAKGRPRVVRGHAYTPARTREYETLIAWVLRTVWAERALMDGPLEVVLRFWMGTRRKVDADNCAKAVLDAAQGMVFEDDSQIVDLRITKGVDRDWPRVEIEVKRSTAEQSG